MTWWLLLVLGGGGVLALVASQLGGAVIIGFLRTWLLPVLTFTIPLPVWAFLAAGGWLWFDRDSAVRTAVNKAVTQMVAGAQLEALQAQLIEERRIRQWSDSQAEEKARIADAEQSARVDLQTKLTLTDSRRKGLADELAELKAREAKRQQDSKGAIAPECAVDDFLFGRLRNK
ncbi:hypothetical protein [Mesorhizobium sp. B2-8-9]|uniref:hypothetical protein n=1 Tax=Mesorhizobium sp. B2-8-9 TaxID=2589899 RepID=UPI00112B975D|nr:hypothetical protein [Mesorhizobium sp. B2-8-9]TPI86374.1 hypothetical protein FJ423_00695 [Mesorhizobium sp. B2-8-9]